MRALVIRDHPIDPGKLVIALGCIYELAALWTRLPTISNIVRRFNKSPSLRVLAWLWGGVWAAHFLTRVDEP